MATVLGRPRHAVTALLLSVVLSGALAVAGPLAPANAHAELLQSVPADGSTVSSVPAVIAMTFSDPIAQQFVRTSLVSPSGTSTPQASTAGPVVSVAVPQNGSGRYTLTYRVVSADGHPVSGTVAFTVAGTATATPSGTPVATAGSAPAPDGSAAVTTSPGVTSFTATASTASTASSSSGNGPWLAVGIVGVVGLLVLLGALALWIASGRRSS